MHPLHAILADQIAAERRLRLMDVAARRRRVRPRPPVDHLPGSTPPLDAA